MSSFLTEGVNNPAKKIQVLKSIENAQNHLDARLRRLKHNILPSAPYIIQAENSFNTRYIKYTYPNNCNNWRKNTRFDDNERQLQYLSFKDRSSDLERKGMHARGAWDDGEGGIAVTEEKPSLTSSDAATPHLNQGQPKRKLTLAEYQNKDRVKVSTEDVRLRGGEVVNVAKITEKQAEQATIAPEATIQLHSDQQGTKRSADTMAVAGDARAFEVAPNSPPTKKIRSTPEKDVVNKIEDIQEVAASKIIETEAQKDAVSKEIKIHSPEVKHEEDSVQDQAQTLKVKLKLPKTEKAARHGLPPMLSPLASDIEEELEKMSRTPSSRGNISSAEKSKARREHNNSTPPSTEKQSASKVLNNVTSKIGSTPTKGPQESKGITSAPRQTSVNPETRKDVAAKPAPNGISVVTTPVLRTSIPEAPRKLRLRITLTVKKKGNRKILSQYLRMKPTPGKYPSGMQRENNAEIARTELTHMDDNTGHKNSQLKASKIGDKRRRLPEDEPDNLNTPEPPIKRQKASGGLPLKTHTPKQSSISSPALSHLSSAQKTHLTTPETGLTSTPMMRVGSGGSSVHTPHQLIMQGTPAAPDTGNSRSSINIPSAGKSKLTDVQSEAKRFTQIGITLKHDADDVYLKNPGANSDIQRKQGVVLGLESVLTFMLSFALGENGTNLGNRTSWDSILPFLSKVVQAAKGSEHLVGLCLQIESYIHDVLVRIDTQRLARNPLDDYFTPKKPDDAKSAEQNKAANFASQFNELRQHADRAQSAIRASWAFLTVDKISAKFPDTWARRATQGKGQDKGQELIKVGEYKTQFMLPLSSTASKLEAVNYGVSMLVEICKSDGIDFTPKLIL